MSACENNKANLFINLKEENCMQNELSGQNVLVYEKGILFDFLLVFLSRLIVTLLLPSYFIMI